MKYKRFPALLLCAVVLLNGCAAGGGENSQPLGEGGSLSSSAEDSSQTESLEADAYHKITAQEAKEMMDEGATVVDVRTAEEYAEKHIDGALLIPVDTIGGTPPEELPDLDAPILVHCRTGVRSKAAAEKLVGLGYTKVYDFGGIVDWPYDTVFGEGSDDE